MKSWQIVLVFCLTHILIFFIVFGTGLYGDYYRDDFMLNYLYSWNVAHGRLPYLDFAVEYPPLGILFLLLPGLVSATEPAIYARFFSIEILFFDLVGLLVIALIARRLRLSTWKTLGVYTFALLGIGPLITVRYDVIPAIVTLLALFTFIRGNYKISWMLLAIGMMTKLYPAVLAPIFLLYHLRQHCRREALNGIVVFAITAVAIAAPILLLSPGGLWTSLTYHIQRGLQVESTYASFLLLGQALGLVSVGVSYGYGSDNLVSPLADMLSKVSLPLMLISLIAVYWLFYKRVANSEDVKGTQAGLSGFDSMYLVGYSLLAILAFMLTSKVLSPQFIIWLYPLIPLVTVQWRNTYWLAFIMIGLLTYFVYVNGAGLETGSLPVVAVLFLRNLALIAFAIFIASKLGKITKLQACSGK